MQRAFLYLLWTVIPACDRFLFPGQVSWASAFSCFVTDFVFSPEIHPIKNHFLPPAAPFEATKKTSNKIKILASAFRVKKSPSCFRCHEANPLPPVSRCDGSGVTEMLWRFTKCGLVRLLRICASPVPAVGNRTAAFPHDGSQQRRQTRASS